MSTVRVLAKIRDANGIQERLQWMLHRNSTFAIESGNVTIYGVDASGRTKDRGSPVASYPPGEYTHVEVRGSEHNSDQW